MNYYEKALFVKTDVAAALCGMNANGLCPSRAMLLCAVNTLWVVAGGVRDWPEPSIGRLNCDFRVTRRLFGAPLRNCPRPERELI